MAAVVAALFVATGGCYFGLEDVDHAVAPQTYVPVAAATELPARAPPVA